MAGIESVEEVARQVGWRLGRAHRRGAREARVRPWSDHRCLGCRSRRAACRRLRRRRADAPSSRAWVTFGVANETFRVSLTTPEWPRPERPVRAFRAAASRSRTQVNTGRSWHLEDLIFADGYDRALRRTTFRRRGSSRVSLRTPEHVAAARAAQGEGCARGTSGTSPSPKVTIELCDGRLPTSRVREPRSEEDDSVPNVFSRSRGTLCGINEILLR